MIELPYFKFFPNQWLTGTIAFQKIEVQGAFIRVCCFYWSKGCKVSDQELKAITGANYNILLETKLIKCVKNKIVIKWLDEQHKERTKAHSKRVEAGSKGGNATAKLKQSYSNTQALRKDKIKKDTTPYLSTKGLDKYLNSKK